MNHIRFLQHPTFCIQTLENGDVNISRCENDPLFRWNRRIIGNTISSNDMEFFRWQSPNTFLAGDGTSINTSLFGDDEQNRFYTIPFQEEPDSVPSLTPVSVPSPTPVPVPSPTPVPMPSPTPFPVPSPTPVPVPSPTPVPVPSPTPVPVPSPTPVQVPSPTPVPVPSPTPVQVPQPTYSFGLIEVLAVTILLIVLMIFT